MMLGCRGDEAKGVGMLGWGEECCSENDGDGATDDGPDDLETTPERILYEEGCGSPVDDGHGGLRRKMICVRELKSSVEWRMGAWMAWGVIR
jgi:hypothetical protein